MKSENALQPYLVENLVPLDADKVPRLIKVHARQLSTAVELRCQLATNFHNRLEHLIVAVAGKQDLAGIQLVKSATYRPHVQCWIVRIAEDYGNY